jgi:acyl-CoA reductase-like NAD-dependent aldehyde dehydrogenase
MLHIPVSRWGEAYKSLDIDKVVHFDTGEALAEVSRANGGLVERDMRFAKRARDVLREIPIKELLGMIKKAADLYTKAELPLGTGSQTPDQFVRMQSATTGLPEHMCRFNMEKNHFVLSGMDKILDALTRGLDLNILARGYGVEERGIPVSYQAQSPVLGMVLPSNSPGVHTLWLPIIPLQVGLVLKPGPQEPWTPYRMAQAFIQAGVPKQAIAIYPGMGDVGAAVLAHCPRSLIFGGTPTVEQYKGNPRVQPKAALAAFTVPGQADAVNASIDQDLKEAGVQDMTASYGPRIVKKERCDYLRPTVVLCESPENAIAKKEYMFPFVTVVKCPQEKMLESIGPTLVCSAITEDPKFQRALADAIHIDRLNIGPIKTIALNWLQPHEGSIVDFLFRARAFQFDKAMIKI